MGRTTKSLGSTLDANGCQGRPLFLDEYNIYWTWDVVDPAKPMATIRGAVFDALVLIETATKRSVAGTSAWNEMDNVYGKMSNSFEMRPAGYVYHVFIRFLQGEMAHATSSLGELVTAFAVSSEFHHGVLLVN
ncbi:MAG TPA: hypothetical protein VE954_29280 [Oligoflexus sp.]|uniref:hypothetical protein n=1 Tax=Oligoflexus sp. TaxID=1971216 RepID=UPI002D68E515|nr:hypothetical protein [Oligoflexus sp.]HYX37216.1 hypothetical protein [Oligoflexus sp.]